MECSSAYWDAAKDRPSVVDASQLAKVQREAIQNYLVRHKESRAYERSMKHREREIRRLYDEKHIAEAQGEVDRIRRAGGLGK